MCTGSNQSAAILDDRVSQQLLSNSAQIRAVQRIQPPTVVRPERLQLKPLHIHENGLFFRIHGTKRWFPIACLETIHPPNEEVDWWEGYTDQQVDFWGEW